MKINSILFVCLGNICRSPMAHAIMQDMLNNQTSITEIVLDSAGTSSWNEGRPMDTRATAKLLEHGIRFSHIARSVRVGDFDDFDLILAMDEDNYESLLSIVTDEQKSKVKMFRDFDPEGGGNVPDPYHGKVDGFEIVYNICYRTCKSLISIIF